jgi:hypothetical protein
MKVLTQFGEDWLRGKWKNCVSFATMVIIEFDLCDLDL